MNADHSSSPLVLIVEDDPMVSDATGLLLKSEGIQAHIARTGDEALASVAAGLKPNFVISDYRLPLYTGIEFIDRFRKLVNSDVPTIMMTGDTSFKTIDAAQLPNRWVLEKPIDADLLISIIRRELATA